MSHPPHLPPPTDLTATPVADASVRIATTGDAASIGRVQAELWRNLYAGVLPDEIVAAFEPDAFADAWLASLTTPPSAAYRALVACEGVGVVGFAALGPSQDPDSTDLDAEVLVFGVQPGSRRQGHGSRLVNAVADTARGSGFGRLRVWVPAAASDLVALFRMAGFEADGAARDRVIGPGDEDLQHEMRLLAAIPE